MYILKLNHLNEILLTLFWKSITFELIRIYKNLFRHENVYIEQI